MSRLVDTKYIGLISPRLQLFKKKGRAWNFRCPFCGDSKKKKTLCRGFFFEYKGSVIYKCHNCGLSIGLSAFITKLDGQLAKQYHYETFAELGQRRSIPIPAKQESFSYVVAEEFPAGVTIPRLSVLPPFHPAVAYARLRKLPLDAYDHIWFVERMRDLEVIAPDRYNNLIPTDARLIMPYYFGPGRMVGLTGRAINPLVQKRYIQMRFEDDVPLVFGLGRHDKNKLTYIVEGPLDSFFLPNAIACGGMDFQKAMDLGIVDRTKTIIVFDNQPRNKDVVKRMSSMVAKKWSTCVWPVNWPYKDINEAVMAGLSPLSVQDIIDSNSFFGLRLEMALKAWRKC